MTEAAAIDQSEIPLPERRSNRPVTFLHRLEFILVVFLTGFFRLIGVDASSALAGGFMRLIGPRLRSISRRAEDNLKMAFPDWPDDKIIQTTKDVWENLGRTSAEFAHLDKFETNKNSGRIKITGEEKLREIAADGTPVIFVSGHFANWEIMPLALQHAGPPYGFIYRAANNPLVDEMIIRSRGKVMSRYQIPKGKRGGRQLIEALKSGRSLAMLVDQKLNDGIEAPFLGHKAMTAPAAARLSLKFGTPVIPISIERLKGANFHVTIKPPIAFTASGDTAADVLNLTTTINAKLEEDIRQRPGQWLWLHRRWPKQNV